MLSQLQSRIRKTVIIQIGHEMALVQKLNTQPYSSSVMQGGSTYTVAVGFGTLSTWASFAPYVAELQGLFTAATAATLVVLTQRPLFSN